MGKQGTLFIIATPIGNPEDITLRALNTLRAVDAVICEERRQGSRILSSLGIKDKEIIPLNEHNEKSQSQDITLRLLNGQNLGLISDCGTPVFADPGAQLLGLLEGTGVTVSPIPGPSSLMAALSVLDIPLKRFVFGGFLPRENEKRLGELKRLQSIRLPLVLMDTPYRLGKLLEEVSKVFGKSQRITLACDLTLPGETIYRGAISDVRSRIGQRKAEFILVVHASGN